LLNKLLPFELQWKFTPLSSIADCSITLTENALIDMLKDLCPPIKDQGEEFTKEHKGVLISQLFGCRFGPARSKKLCLVSDNNRTRYVLSNSVIIIGPSLSVIVIDTFSKKKPKSINTAAENEVVDLEGFKWKTSQNLEFDSVATLTAGEAKSTRFVGIDVGQTFAVGICAKNAGLGIVRNLAIKSNALRIPQKRFQKYLAEKKNKFDGCFEAERDMTRKPSETLTEFTKRWFQEYCFLHSLYNSKAMKKRNWDLERAIEAEFSIADNSILKMVDKQIS
jgi:hypothetical protein